MYFSPFLLVSDGPLSLRQCSFCSSCSHALSLEHICQILLCSSCCFLLRSSAYTFFPVLGVFQLNEFAYTSAPTTVLPTSELPAFAFVCKLPLSFFHLTTMLYSPHQWAPVPWWGWVRVDSNSPGAGITLVKFLRNLVKFANITNSSITQRFTNLHGGRILSRHISHASSLTTLLSSQHY